ncbi:bacterial low temperature requirement A protein-domain-containing protein [Amylocarpus encephaloides]|uniref:Bacterial low temperature requirement A protein-domain-containing protein n=1 Tax=Amylocarpus encephaloides TaxID=45428 RepID=A0A9P7YJN9_9HELO|nr:bacterial low temperature requirement A protein-domain-containing protein [Amylocarpus encephaloides]
MSTTPTNTLSGATLGGQHHHHRRGRRLRNFMLPNGREVHIALSPEEAETLRQRLEAVRSKEDPFDLVISGSPEHLEALRQAHTHHEGRRDAMREEHGEKYDEFENVRAELDVLGSELHMLTDHAVSLDANFSKYGYSAHLRTYDDGSAPQSSRSSMSGWNHDPDHEKKDWASEKKNGKSIKIYNKPTVRQYFHKGLLWRASETTEVASFELFLDLLYVGILAINGDHVSEEPNAYELQRFAVSFIMSWKIWSDTALVISWFYTDDIIQRISVLFTMACLLGLTTQMLESFKETWTMLVSFYLAARLFMGLYYVSLIFFIPMIRGMMIVNVILITVPSALWIGSTYLEYPNRMILVWVAIFIDLSSAMVAMLLVRASKLISVRFGEWTDKVFEFYPAINIEHKVERTNAFVSLVFGYSVVATIYQSSASYGLNAFFGKAVLGLTQAFCFNWIYFELDGSELYTHAIRRNVTAAMAWGTVHLPFIMSYILGAAALSKLVVAHDCSDADAHDLTHSYEEKSEEHIPQGLRWFYCVGLGIALAMMGVISVSHLHKDPPNGVRIRKSLRLTNRFTVCVVLVCLPLAEHLNSLQLISVVTGLLLYVLLIELWGAGCPGDSIWGDWKNGEGAKCKYTARCNISKKDLESAVKGGQVIKVEELKDRGEKGMLPVT